LNRLPWRLDDNRRARRFGSFHFEIIEGQIGSVSKSRSLAMRHAIPVLRDELN
jgi:hypothetical protein